MTASEGFDQAIDLLLQNQSPRENISSLSQEERRMLQMAQLLRGSAGESLPSPAFRADLDMRLRRSKPQRISRRTAVVSGLGALAAGVAAGFGLDRGLVGGSEAATYSIPLVGKRGRWTHVADVADLPEGSVMSFTAGAIAGFLVHRNGRVRAYSGVCTHMGCLLRYDPPAAGFICPCHGAEFSLEGKLLKYPRFGKVNLPPLPWLKSRVRDTSIQVWTA